MTCHEPHMTNADHSADVKDSYVLHIGPSACLAGVPGALKQLIRLL